MIRRLAVTIAFFGIAACAATDPASDGAMNNENPVTDGKSSTGEPVAVAENGDEIVCRREKKPGSRLKTRICRTRTEMEMEREAARNMLRDNLGGPSGGGSQ